MIDPEQIPDEVVEAAARTLAGSAQLNLMAWNAPARAVIVAGLNAWPGWEGSWTGDGDTLRRTIILPLSQEKE